MRISFIFYDGVVPDVESDEYAQITNNGSGIVDLQGWRLNAGDPGQDFSFPSYIIKPDKSCQDHTNETLNLVGLALGAGLLFGITAGIEGICITTKVISQTCIVIKKDQSISKRDRINRIYIIKSLLHEISPARLNALTSFGFTSTAIINYCDVLRDNVLYILLNTGLVLIISV